MEPNKESVKWGRLMRKIKHWKTLNLKHEGTKMRDEEHNELDAEFAKEYSKGRKSRQGEIDRLKEERDCYREALEFYGNENQWTCFTHSPKFRNKITCFDVEVGSEDKRLHIGGKRARQALDKYPETNPDE